MSSPAVADPAATVVAGVSVERSDRRLSPEVERGLLLLVGLTQLAWFCLLAYLLHRFVF